jgi:hypothetical protein
MGEGRGQCARGRLLWAEKSAAGGHLLPGWTDRKGCGKPGFIGFFYMARHLLRNAQEFVGRYSCAALLEFRHVLCSGRSIIGDRCPQGTRIVEVIHANHRRQSGLRKLVRLDIIERIGFDRSGNWLGRLRRFDDIAGNHERAA